MLDLEQSGWVLAGNDLMPGRAVHSILGASWENEDYIIDVGRALHGPGKPISRIVGSIRCRPGGIQAGRG